jgi:type 1 glutamine amidotransferase
MMEKEHPLRKDGVLVVGGTSHDMDFVRLELLKLLAGYDNLRVTCVSDFEALDAVAKASFAIAYTCNVQPSAEAEQVLRAMVARGGRLLALHATNALLDFTPSGVAARPAAADFMELLGSQFVAHPPMGSFAIEVTDSLHPLTAGIAAFETTDELYLADIRAPVRVLLHTHFAGTAPGFTQSNWQDSSPRPILYTRVIGDGEIVYFNLGHARGHYDAPHRMPYWPQLERGSWDTPEYRELLQRCIRWVARIGTDFT